jgi:type II secretory ATPase GspE/PulE/Tfp pilus assembly ATPase PilB-like protein
MINDVLHLRARPSEEKAKNLDMSSMVDLILHLNPDIIMVGEMVDAESYVTTQAARTGHVVVTTVHSPSAEDTYSRISELCMRHPDAHIDFNMMQRLSMEAFPVVAYLAKVHKRRKLMAIVEGENYNLSTELVESRRIYRYNTSMQKHEKVGTISEKLANTLLDHGASQEEINKYFK